MSAISNLYNEVVLDHIKNARNYRVIDDADRTEEGTNPLCGDTLSLYVKFDGDVILDASFQCSCCGISMASASVMTQAVKGSTVAEARQTYRSFLGLLEGPGETEVQADLGEIAVLAVVREFPARRNCAALAWDTLMTALDSRGERVRSG
jgi:nitrogen fixation NifU-like protein